MSLADRLRKVQTPAAPPQIPDMPLEGMEELCLEFGQKHVGKKFRVIWDTDQEWITWVTSHYGKSTKRAHQIFMMYVEKKVAELEKRGGTVEKTAIEVPPTPPHPTLIKSKVMMPRAKTKGVPSTALPIPETEEEYFDLIESLASVEDHLPPTEHQADVATLQQRMLHMENALMQIMNHLQTQQ